MGHVFRTRASFSIGASLTMPPGALPDPQFVTDKLGIVPSSSHKAGERLSPRSTGFKHGQWSLTSPLPRDSQLESHLVWLLERLSPVSPAVREILGTDERLRARFFCGLWLKDWNEMLGFAPKTLQAIADLNADLDLDIYWWGDDDSEPPGDAPAHSESP